jgi:uncharacterized damage-inducible protein DinB
MTRTEAQTLIDYNYWARDRLMESVSQLSPEQFTRDLGSSFRSVRDTLAHLHSAEWAWYSRWLGDSPMGLLPAERFPDVASVDTGWRELEGQVRAFFDPIDDRGLQRIVDFKSLTGVPGSFPLWQLLQHVVNHGSYHRGQVTTMIRQLGAPPPKSQDLIAFYRERAVRA